MKPSVSLVLSSGGARGIAHIGVIEELERQGFEIKSIAGSSMGALVGGIYASGNLKIYRDWMCRLDKKSVFNLADFTLSTNGIIKGNKIINELKKIVPDMNIEDLPISYTAVAADIKNKKEVVFEKGSLYEAVRASISIPGVFKPYKLDEMVLIDGGVVNPLPINRVKRTPSDLLIAVDVSASLKPESKPLKHESLKQNENKRNIPALLSKNWMNSYGEPFNYYTLFAQSSSMMLQQMSAMSVKMNQPDILIKMPMNPYGAFHYYKSEEIIRLGAMAAQRELSGFDKVKAQILSS